MGEKTVKHIYILMAVLAAVLCLCFAVLIGVVILSQLYAHLRIGSPPEIPLTSDDLAHTPNHTTQIIKIILYLAFALIGGLVAIVLIEEQKNKESTPNVQKLQLRKMSIVL